MTFDDLIRKYGDDNTAIAKGLGTDRQLVAHWRKKGVISPSRQAWIQVQTKGRLRADKPEDHDAR